MNYAKFIDEELSKNLETIYSTMYKLNLMDEKEYKKNMEILKKLHELPKKKTKTKAKSKTKTKTTKK